MPLSHLGELKSALRVNILSEGKRTIGRGEENRRESQ